ncbi:RNA recognition motif domain-containing protein [Desulfatiglans anilini]|uniref:RNA recognition motif domain-containing protein n=1 Tax=Desulfatiglans anilini TaxID=90728 RepID=UPI00041BE5F4|nr:hypothetical protein [Desulfatiglans anilini]
MRIAGKILWIASGRGYRIRLIRTIQHSKEYNLNVKKIYVGNLPFSASEEKVHKVFSQFGEVHSVKLLTDPVTGRIRGFGFVEMESDAADAAIKALDGAPFEYRKLRVHEAFERVRTVERSTPGRTSGGNFHSHIGRREPVLTVGGQRSSRDKRYSQAALRRG